MKIRSLGYDPEADELDLLIDVNAPVPAEVIPIGEGIYIHLKWTAREQKPCATPGR